MPATLSAEKVRTLIDEELASLVDLRHDLHAHPELGYEERRTSEVVQRELKAAGVEFRAGLAGGTGVLASIPGSGTGNRPADQPAVGLRADIDALPIVEQTDVPYRSTTRGRMHACGHDGHTTILIGTARVLARLAREGGLPRPVSLLFQPAEEGGGGGKRMVEDGCLDGRVIGPPIERMFGLHGWPSSPLGVVSTKAGPLFAASDRFEIAVHGHGGHAAWPETCRDPIVAASAVVQAIQSIVSRNVAPQDPAVVSVTRFDAGTSFNIIPDGAVLQGTVRTLRTEVQELVRQRLGEIVQQVSAGHGCDATFEYIVNYPVMVNDAAAAETVRLVAAEAFGPERVRRAEQPEMVGEDFAYYGQRIPACFFLLGLRPHGAASMPSLHHPRFDFNDKAIAPGVEMFVRLALAG